MPAQIYRNRPPLAADTELRRHMSLGGLLHTLRTGRLRLTRVDTFVDPFEGSVPQKELDDQVPLFSSRNVFFEGGMNPGTDIGGDPWTEMTLRRRARVRSAHASCWSAGPESEAMWRLYCRDRNVKGQGVALESTLATVEASVASHAIYVSPIAYRLYHLGPAFTDELDPFMHKRLGFAHEAEVRLLSFNHTHYLALAEALRSQSTPPANLRKHISLAWSASEVVVRFIVSPYASKAYEEEVKSELGELDPSLAGKVELSVLSERRYAPGF